MEFGRDGPFMLVPKERGRSTNNQHFCHRAEIGFIFKGKTVDRGKKIEGKKRRKSRSVWKVEKKGSAGKGAGKCVDRQICRI